MAQPRRGTCLSMAVSVGIDKTADRARQMKVLISRKIDMQEVLLLAPAQVWGSPLLCIVS